MEVLNSRAALLSNYEVFTLLRELETDHLARAKTAVRIKKEEEAAGHPPRHPGSDTLFGEPSENLRTVEVEAIQYLSADYLPTQRQTPEGISQLVQDLAPYELTKAEKLQVVNLAPTMPVELYVIVEELEDRLGDRMEEILTHVQSALALSPATIGPTSSNGNERHPPAINSDSTVSTLGGELAYPEDEAYHEEFVFDDVGEGAGVEGDLDMEDD
ncbi:DNA-directed RNA polymerase III subunit RPC9 [Hypsizygus marmoreus]|uniref:DNA-directed RNA polymerase III subunit RPC9 n=1 Tax=Hypsizygus marmoreus TaxID=39966 RepID=A0A369JBS8_HYPMA|nr:DNA-directed RNA polymerase III subunit RPC9 [Hypsizygus marmoreus]